MFAILLALSLVLPAASQSPAAPTANAIGTWDLTFNTDQGAISAQLVLKRDADKIAGSISSEQSGTVAVEAHVDGKSLTVWFNYPGQDGAVPVEMDGTIDGDSVKGNFTFGGDAAGSFTGSREKDAAPTAPSAGSKDSPAASTVSLTGTWNVSLQLDSMSANPTLTLKQDGNTLTGDYTSEQYGKFPVTGTVKGNDVTVTFPMSVQGTSLNVTYTGTIEKDGSLKGRANYGDMMSGTFVATKKGSGL